MPNAAAETDVVVVGAGNAACSAAMAAREAGARVIMLEAAPREERGGNSTYTAGALRLVYNDAEDVKSLSHSQVAGRAHDSSDASAKTHSRNDAPSKRKSTKRQERKLTC